MRGTPDRHGGPPRHLYVHVPFCRRKCDYCDFCSVPLGAARGRARGSAACHDALLDGYVDAVLAEWAEQRRAFAVGSLHTVYLGGGTPSLLGPARLERLVRVFDTLLTPQAEVTLEMNPEDVDERLAEWAVARRVRISLGAQSFLPQVRRSLGRRSSGDPAGAYARLRAAGCENIGLDLIFAVPGQTAADLEHDLHEVADLKPDHVSWYELEVVAGTPLARRVAAAEAATAGARGSGTVAERGAGDRPAAMPGADLQALMYRRIVRGLEGLGYRWYEVSNFAYPGRRCRHNTAVWRGESYLGLGPSAVGTVGRTRRRTAADVPAYLAAWGDRADRTGSGTAPPAEGEARPSKRHAPAVHSEERLDASALCRERVYLAARTGAEVSLDDVRHVLDPDALEGLAAAGFVSSGGGTLRVTRKGRHLADAVCVRLFRAFCC